MYLARTSGGLFFLHEGDIFKLDNFDTTGLSVKGRKVLRGIQPSSLWLYDSGLVEITKSTVPFDDIHDVYLDDQFVYLVGTSGNEIIKLNSNGNELQRWSFPGEKDALHINCLSKWNGRIVFSAFGEFTEYRGYKGKTEKAGFVQDLYTGQRLITGLSQPHSLVPAGQNLFLANSEVKELSEYGPSGDLVRTLTLDGYTRGICLVNNTIYVGLSRSRNVEFSDSTTTATVVALDRDSLEEMGRVHLPVAEIYSIQEVANYDDVIHALADITSNSSSWLTSEIAERDGQIDNLNQAVSERDGQIEDLQRSLAETVGELVDARNSIKDSSLRIERLEQHLSMTESRNASHHDTVMEYEARLNRLISSRSWRITKPFRFAGRLIRGEVETAIAPLMEGNLKGAASVARQAMNAMRYIARGDIRGLRDRLNARSKDVAISSVEKASHMPGEKLWAVIATRHTLYIAHLIAERIRLHGWQVEVVTDVPANCYHDWYIVLCPQMFDRLPPGERRIVYQLEQSVSSRWFSDEYYRILENSLAVLEYALTNIDFLQHKGIAYPHVYYLPIGSSENYGEVVPEQSKSHDVLFYGDANSSARRRKMLEVLRQHFDVSIVSEVFGYELLEAIKQARVVINIHYYENALLEMPRIQECLSLGVPVVSESAQDQDDYPELNGVVRFFDEGSIPAMLSAVRLALDNPVSAESILDSVELGAKRFSFMFDRFLVAMGFLPSSHVRTMQVPVPPSVDCIALSLPETIERRKIFEADRPSACFVFDGLRRRPGWVGCGLSYLALAEYALNNGHSSLKVMEDDVILPPDFDEKMEVIQEYLHFHNGKWDVFSGVIASIHPECVVSSVEVFKNLTFVTINKMTSMVFNIYSDNFLRLIISWDPENLDPVSNTIDRYIESLADLRVVLMLPFFVGHREEVHSTLWGFKNIQYKDMIAASQAALHAKVLAFQESSRSTQNISIRTGHSNSAH